MKIFKNIPEAKTTFNKKFMPQMNATISQYGKYFYGAVGLEKTGYPLVVKSKDLVNWELVKIVNDIDIAPAFESAIYVEDDIFYIASRQHQTKYKHSDSNVARNRLVVAKYSLTDKQLINYSLFPNANSRPEFFSKNNELYLIHNGYEKYRDESYISKIDKKSLYKSIKHREVNAGCIFEYFSVNNYNKELYISYSSSSGIKLSKISIEDHFDVDKYFKKFITDANLKKIK